MTLEEVQFLEKLTKISSWLKFLYGLFPKTTPGHVPKVEFLKLARLFS